MIPVAYGAVYGKRFLIVSTAATESAANTTARNRSEPALPA